MDDPSLRMGVLGAYDYHHYLASTWDRQDRDKPQVHMVGYTADTFKAMDMILVSRNWTKDERSIKYVYSIK